MDNPNETAPVPPESPSPPSMPLMARLANVFAAPGEVFDAVRTMRSSAANWLVPALMLLLLSWISVAVILSQDSLKHQLDDLISAPLEKQAAAQHMSEQQTDQMRSMAKTISQIGMVAAPPVAAFVMPFWWGLILWLIGAKLFKGGFGYLKAVEAAGLANMISVLDVIVRTLLILGMNNLSVSLSLALFLKHPDPQNLTHTLLAILNFMTLWRLAVLTIALSRLSRVSFCKAALWVYGLWAAWMGVTLGIAALGQALGRMAR
jgi:hypothetical protein